MNSKIKTEHSGAKNGGGFWGLRAEAKELCKRLRRQNDKTAIQAALLDAFEEAEATAAEECELLDELAGLKK